MRWARPARWGSPGRLGAVAAIAAGIALAAAPAPALAGEAESVDGYTYLHASSELPAPPESGSAPTVICPGRKTVIGLGGGIESGVVGHVNSLYPLDTDDEGSRADEAVALDAHNASGEGKEITAQAVCKGGRHKYVTREETVAPSAAEGLSARCPDETHVVGGGAFVGGDIGDGRLLSTTPFDRGDADAKPDDGWRVKVANGSPTAGSDVTVHAICQRAKVRYEVSDPLTLTAGAEMGVLSDCDDEAHLLGAGADLSLDPDAQVSRILLQDSVGDADLARDDLAAVTLTHRDAGGTDAGVTLTDICARP